MQLPRAATGIASAARPASTSRLALGSLLSLLLLSAGGCEPELDQRLSVLDEPRVLAVVSEPAETSPGDEATHTAWIAGADGQISPLVKWAFCTEPKPPTEDNVVNARCLGNAVRDLGERLELLEFTPLDACMRFGPDVSSDEYRPRDPDVTGGYYQPLRLTLPAAQRGQIAFASHRIRCNLANAPVEVVRAYRERYAPNQNPAAASLGRGDGADAGSARPGERLPLVASWPTGASERYVSYDPRSARLRDRREGLRVSWYVTGGQLCSDATGQTEDEIAEAAARAGDADAEAPAGETTNCWEAPAAASSVTVWLVLRDSRGGAAVSQHEIVVSP